MSLRRVGDWRWISRACAYFWARDCSWPKPSKHDSDSQRCMFPQFCEHLLIEAEGTTGPVGEAVVHWWSARDMFDSIPGCHNSWASSSRYLVGSFAFNPSNSDFCGEVSKHQPRASSKSSGYVFLGFSVFLLHSSSKTQVFILWHVIHFECDIITQTETESGPRFFGRRTLCVIGRCWHQRAASVCDRWPLPSRFLMWDMLWRHVATCAGPWKNNARGFAPTQGHGEQYLVSIHTKFQSTTIVLHSNFTTKRGEIKQL